MCLEHTFTDQLAAVNTRISGRIRKVRGTPSIAIVGERYPGSRTSVINGISHFVQRIIES
jgi:hypothetical protein